jgi:hypothetical protein
MAARRRASWRMRGPCGDYQGTRAARRQTPRAAPRSSSQRARDLHHHALHSINSGNLRSRGKFFFKIKIALDSQRSFWQELPAMKSDFASIFFLTSIFNHSIHSSIAVFYSDRRFHENGKGE